MARRTRRRNTPPPHQGSAWLVLGLLLGLGVAAAMNWESVQQYLVTLTQTEKPQSTATKASSVKTKPPAEKPKKQSSNPEFDFYNILSNKKVDAPDETPTPKKASPKTESKPLVTDAIEKTASSTQEAPPSTAETPSPTAHSANAETKQQANEAPQRYVIQIASFPTYQEADRLRAELTMSGFDVYIQSAQQDNNTRYRVNMGPYASKEIATTKQADLRSQSISSLLIKQ